jgi:hypothetical protein
MENLNGSIFVESNPETKAINVSYSQYALWTKCPHAWKLAYIDKLSKYEGNLNTFLGSALHFTLQTYIDTLYKKSALDADSLNLFGLFWKEMRRLRKDVKNKEVKIAAKDYADFLNDGKLILDWFSIPANRIKFFPSKIYEVVGIEFPLHVSLKNNLSYIGYLDIVLKNKIDKRIKIIDLKSASYGWNNYKKNDESTTNQLLLYKKFYSDKFNVPLDSIDIEFLIFKRKLYEGVTYDKSRGQKFIPPHGKVSIKKAVDSFNHFLEACFTVNGTHNISNHFPKRPNKGKTKCGNCTYCEFKNTKHCDQKED